MRQSFKVESHSSGGVMKRKNFSKEFKSKVVEEVKNSLNLKNVVAQPIRTDNVKTKFDFVLGRAISNFPKFCYNICSCLNVFLYTGFKS